MVRERRRKKALVWAEGSKVRWREIEATRALTAIRHSVAHGPGSMAVALLTERQEADHGRIRFLGDWRKQFSGAPLVRLAWASKG